MPAAAPGLWALLAMTATMGGTMRAPLTATFFAVELTGATGMLVPLITACVAAHAVTVLLMRRSILTEKLARRGHHLVREYRTDPFALTRVAEVMTTDVDTVPASMTLHQAVSFLTNPATRHPTFPVVDENMRVLGVIDPPAVLRWRRRGEHRRATLDKLVTGTNVVVAYPDEFLEQLAEKLNSVNVSHLPVVTRDSGQLVGYIGWKDVMRVRLKLRSEEQSRKAFFRIIPRRSIGAADSE
jgi:CBS domain-containing protein